MAVLRQRYRFGLRQKRRESKKRQQRYGDHDENTDWGRRRSRGDRYKGAVFGRDERKHGLDGDHFRRVGNHGRRTIRFFFDDRQSDRTESRAAYPHDAKRQTPYVTDRKLVDGEGNVVENKDGYAFDVSDIFRDGKVAEGSLKIDYLYNGDFSLSVKSLSAADYKTVLKTSSQKLPAIAGGQVGVYFMESTDTSKHVLDAELYEVKVGSVTENGCKEIARFGEEDVLKDYYYSVSPASE